jgi:hypothetical protein
MAGTEARLSAVLIFRVGSAWNKNPLVLLMMKLRTNVPLEFHSRTYCLLTKIADVSSVCQHSKKPLFAAVVESKGTTEYSQ